MQLTCADDAGAPTVLKGKPSQVIQQFVRDNNIDLLVIPVTPQATLKRMDKESKRGPHPFPSDYSYSILRFGVCSSQ